MKGRERWDYISKMRTQGISDDEIADRLNYASKQSLWNWISRNKSKYENVINGEKGFWGSIADLVSGTDKSAYLGGLFIGYFIRQLLDSGGREINFEKSFSMYHSIWISFFLKSSFKKGIAQGVGLKDLPVLVGDLSSWYEQIRIQ